MESLKGRREASVLVEHARLVRKSLGKLRLTEANEIELNNGSGLCLLFSGYRATSAEYEACLSDIKEFMDECPLLDSSILASWDVVDLQSGQSVSF